MKPKMVDVYHVASRRSQAVGDVVELVRHKPFLQPVFVSGDVEEGVATIDVVPVHCYRLPDGSETYLAVAPDVRELIEAYVQKPVREELWRVNAVLGSVRREVNFAQQRIAAFAALPWWRRVWVALRGGVL